MKTFLTQSGGICRLNLLTPVKTTIMNQSGDLTMSDLRIEKLADLLVNYSVNVKKGDKVAIQGDSITEPLLKAIYTSVLQAGGHPFIIMSPQGIDDLFYRYASDEQIQHIP